MRIGSVGQAVFASTMIALGIAGFVTGDFAAIWRPVPKGVPAREALVYLCAAISLACGIGLFGRRTAAIASRALFVYLLIWMLLFKVRFIIRAPGSAVSYETTAETAVLVAAALALAAGFGGEREGKRPGLAKRETGMRIARVLSGLSLVAFGVAHFAYVQMTASLVPGWLPWHVAWVEFTGATFIAAGAAVLTGVLAGLAAALAALQFGLFTLLVWAPLAASGHADASQWSEFAVSCAVTAGAWVVADSYRRGRGIAVNEKAIPQQI